MAKLFKVNPVTAATSTPDAGSAFAQEISIPVNGLASCTTACGIACDKSENVYVCDSTNHVIYRYRQGAGIPATSLQPQNAAGGTIFAGQYGVAGNVDQFGQPNWPNYQAGPAKFNAPSAICVDNSGNLWVVDSGNSLIRKIDQNGNVFTVAQLSAGDNVGGIAVDASGHLFVIRTGNVVLPPLPPDISLGGTSNAPSEYGM